MIFLFILTVEVAIGSGLEVSYIPNKFLEWGEELVK